MRHALPKGPVFQSLCSRSLFSQGTRRPSSRSGWGSWLLALHPWVLSSQSSFPESLTCAHACGGWRAALVVAPLVSPTCIFWNGVSYQTWRFLSRLAQLATKPQAPSFHQCWCCDSKHVLPCPTSLHGFWGSNSGPWAHEAINFLTAISRPCISWGGVVLVLFCSEVKFMLSKCSIITTELHSRPYWLIIFGTGNNMKLYFKKTHHWV